MMETRQGVLPEQVLDDLARLIRLSTGAETALVSLLDDKAQHMIGQSGLPQPWCDVRVAGLEASLCHQVMRRGEALILGDTRADPEFASHPAVTEYGVGAYIGLPLRAADGAWIGVVCASQGEPRIWTEEDQRALGVVVEMISSELRSRQLFDAHPQPLWVYDRATLQFLMVNDAAIARYGYSREQFLAMTVRDIRPPEDAPEVERRIAELSGHNSEARHWRHRLKSGETILVEISSNDLRIDGRAARLAVATDVTERVRARTEITEAKQRYEDAMDASLACFAEYDLGEEAFTFDRGSVEIMGFKLCDLGRERFFERIHPDDVAKFMRARMRIDATASREDFLFRLVDDRDRLRWLRIIIQPKAGEDGAVAKVLCGITDVTELVEARRVAERSLRQQSDFLAGVSHELRTPLNAILGLGQILQMSEGDPERLSYLKVIADSGATLLAQIEQLLDLSQAEEGEDGFRSEHYDPALIAGQALSSVRFAAMSKGLTLRLEAGDAPRFAYGDPRRLRQILVALLENAVKFTDLGGVVLEIPAANHMSLRFVVSDTGIGIPEEIQPVIFDVFTRGDPSSHRRRGGMGIGLAVVRHILDAMGGSIAVASEAQGSTFTITLPLVALRAAQPSALRA